MVMIDNLGITAMTGASPRKTLISWPKDTLNRAVLKCLPGEVPVTAADFGTVSMAGDAPWKTLIGWQKDTQYRGCIRTPRMFLPGLRPGHGGRHRDRGHDRSFAQENTYRAAVGRP